MIISLRQVNSENLDLKKEVQALKRIQNNQGKQIFHLETDDSNLTKIKSLVDQLKWSKDQCKEKDDELKRQIRVC